NMDKNSVKIKGFFILIVLLVATIFGAYLITNIPNVENSYQVKTFSSYDELLDFLKTNYESYNGSNYQYLRGDSLMMAESDGSESKSGDDGSTDYSTTNVQVEGVDEPDIVKTDGIYLYALSDQNLYILKAYPVNDANILSKISIKEDVYISEFFVNDDYLIVFGSSYNYPILYGGYIDSDEKTGDVIPEEESWEVSSSVIKIYDISEKENPELVKDIEIDGTYFDSRMIGDYIYVVSSEHSYYIYRHYEGNYSLNVPEITIDNDTKKIPYDQIYYADSPEIVDTMTHVIAINLNDMEINEKSFLIGISENMYMSENNIYLVYTKYEYDTDPLIGLPYTSYEETTVIHKIQVDNGDIGYVSNGEVPGHVLNQFSMDEHNNFFRLATTKGFSWDETNPSKNNIYILDENLKRISAIEGIAEGEQIYSSRFIGDKAYLVTFKNTDPFYTIDLSDPYDPKILGYLKIPGYSNYLHPYDENHIIGIGKDTVETNDTNFAWYQGLKIALFDVSDFENPKEIDKMIIGDRGTDSPALYDHKAFLFDKGKELLVLPISLYEISDEIKSEYEEYPGEYGEFTFQGAYVIRLNLDGFDYRGRITHVSDDEKQENENWWFWRQSSAYISRSLYIDDVLYTISNKMVKMNSLDDLSEIKSVILS
ncbi:MAG: beta-propeller domain-containing protein, partial [Thermoplasmatales archaeon]|nr:beta-propeller domain-containing protein [Thermoplasmatales archaeon]